MIKKILAGVWLVLVAVAIGWLLLRGVIQGDQLTILAVVSMVGLGGLVLTVWALDTVFEGRKK